LKQVAELQNLTLVGHPAVARHSTMVGHPTMARHPIVARHPTMVGHPIEGEHGMSTPWQNVQDKVLQQQPTLEGHSKAGSLADLAGITKKRSTGA
jgi:hypothetical protein